MVHALKGLSIYAVEGRKVGVSDKEVNVFTCEALFSTVTNVNFDQNRVAELTRRAVRMRDSLLEKVKAAGGAVKTPQHAATFKLEPTMDGMVSQSAQAGLKFDASINPDILSLQHILLFGLKGVAAYADHAHILGQDDDTVYAFLQEGLASLTRTDLGLDEWIGLVLKCGEVNLRTMGDP